MSGFWAVPRSSGRSGLAPRARKRATASRFVSLAMSSGSMTAIFWISWEVRNPSKKCKKGTLDSMAARWATSPRSIASWTEAEAIIPNPVWRVAITSWWSPKMESACAAMARAVTWNTPGSSSPEILYMLGIMSSRPWEAVKVEVSAPAASEPCTEAAAPASDCSWRTVMVWPKMFLRPEAAHSSAISAMGDDGVMG